MCLADRGSSAKVCTIREWLESPYLARLAKRVGVRHALKSEDVLDLLQEVRLALWRAGPDLCVNVSWIFRTVEHKAVDYRRKMRQERERASEVGDYPESRPVNGAELLHLLRAKAAILPLGLRRFYTLRYEEGWSEREIAARLGLCRGSIRWMDEKCKRSLQGPDGASPQRVSSFARPA
jgi:RNA polymerase sigma factor (sigma-70 family)